MKVADIIASKTLYVSEEIELLKADVKIFLNKGDPNAKEILALRANPFSPLSPDDIRFRSRERSENTRRLLQHLVYFLGAIPGAAGSGSTQLNPIAPFMKCVRSEVDLLRADDVMDGIFNEINQMESLHGDTVWDYMRRVIDKKRELNELLVTGSSDAASQFLSLCLVLEELCLFWFDVKQEEMCRIRFGDLLIFKLALILQARCRQA